MSTVYLETSIISAIVTTRTDNASQYRREVSLEWWNTQAGRHQLFVSLEVIAELSHRAFLRSAEALKLIQEGNRSDGPDGPRTVTVSRSVATQAP